MREPSRSAFHEWYDLIDHRLEAGGDGDQRAALRDEVVALFRAVEREIRELGALKDQIRVLVEKWRTFGRTTNASGRAAPPSRSDLIGATTFIEKGWARLSVGDFEAAEAALAKALDLSPDDDGAAALLGWAQMMRENYDEALPRLRQLVATHPTNAIARMNVGYICFKQGRIAEAIEHLWRAICLDNDRKATLYSHYFLGLIYAERELYRDAESHFVKSLDLGPNLIEAYFQLGHARRNAGDESGAREAWRRGAAAHKFNPWGKRCAEVLHLVESGSTPAVVS